MPALPSAAAGQPVPVASLSRRPIVEYAACCARVEYDSFTAAATTNPWIGQTRIIADTPPIPPECLSSRMPLGDEIRHECPTCGPLGGAHLLIADLLPVSECSTHAVCESETNDVAGGRPGK